MFSACDVQREMVHVRPERHSRLSRILARYSMAATLAASTMASAANLRVCADPNNLPFSNERGQGFENELARLAAHDLGLGVQFVWWPQHGRYLKKTLFGGLCDVVIGVPAKMDRLATTRPYYRSSYVFVWRRGRWPAIQSFDDAALTSARIGVQFMQNDHDLAPPAQALIDRGLARNIVWYKLYPDFTRPNPPSALIEAVELGDVEVAVAWGPMAGYFAGHSRIPLAVSPVSPQQAGAIPLAFDISMGVKPDNTRLLTELNEFIGRRQTEIRGILAKYGVPLTGGLEHQSR